jgi:hypothetical protein
MVSGGPLANHIVVAGLRELLDWLRTLAEHRGPAGRFLFCGPEAEEDVCRRCERLARHLPEVTGLGSESSDAIWELVRFAADPGSLTFANGGLAKVFGAVAALTAAPDFCPSLIDFLAVPKVGTWGPALAPIVLRFICAHQSLPNAAVKIANHRLHSNWSRLDRATLGAIVDVMCAYVHLGVPAALAERGFVENVLAHLARVADPSDPGTANALIRWAATQLLSFGTPLRDG